VRSTETKWLAAVYYLLWVWSIITPGKSSSSFKLVRIRMQPNAYASRKFHSQFAQTPEAPGNTRSQQTVAQAERHPHGEPAGQSKVVREKIEARALRQQDDILAPSKAGTDREKIGLCFRSEIAHSFWCYWHKSAIGSNHKQITGDTQCCQRKASVRHCEAIRRKESTLSRMSSRAALKETPTNHIKDAPGASKQSAGMEHIPDVPNPAHAGHRL